MADINDRLERLNRREEFARRVQQTVPDPGVELDDDFAEVLAAVAKVVQRHPGMSIMVAAADGRPGRTVMRVTERDGTVETAVVPGPADARAPVETHRPSAVSGEVLDPVEPALRSAEPSPTGYPGGYAGEATRYAETVPHQVEGGFPYREPVAPGWDRPAEPLTADHGGAVAEPGDRRRHADTGPATFGPAGAGERTGTDRYGGAGVPEPGGGSYPPDGYPEPAAAGDGRTAERPGYAETLRRDDPGRAGRPLGEPDLPAEPFRPRSDGAPGSPLDDPSDVEPDGFPGDQSAAGGREGAAARAARAWSTPARHAAGGHQSGGGPVGPDAAGGSVAGLGLGAGAMTG